MDNKWETKKQKKKITELNSTPQGGRVQRNNYISKQECVREPVHKPR